MEKKEETRNNAAPKDQQLLSEKVRRFDELRKAIQLNDKNCIVNISQELIDKYYVGGENDELSKILIDLILEGKSKLILKLKYTYSENSSIPMIQELFVDYTLKKMVDFIDYFADRKNLNEKEKKEFYDSIIDSVVESSYGIIKGVTLDHNAYKAFELDKLFFEQFTDMIFDIAYRTLNSKPDYRSNIKYTSDMYKYTDSLLLAGKKKYVACGETLIKFGFSPVYEDSYRKCYSNNLKKRK